MSFAIDVVATQTLISFDARVLVPPGFPMASRNIPTTSLVLSTQYNGGGLGDRFDDVNLWTQLGTGQAHHSSTTNAGLPVAP